MSYRRMEELPGEAMASTVADGSKAERYGVWRWSLPAALGELSDQSRTVLSREQDTNVSDPGDRDREVTAPLWPGK